MEKHHYFQRKFIVLVVAKHFIKIVQKLKMEIKNTYNVEETVLEMGIYVIIQTQLT